MYKLKEKCSDFLVDEIPGFDVVSLDNQSGDYLYLKLVKENWNSISAVQELAKALGVAVKDISFAGTKDKYAITSQYVSVKVKGKNFLDKFPLSMPQGITVDSVGFAKEPLSLGTLVGNKFTIVVRNLEKNEEVATRKLFINYFDEQRFSVNNVEIGRAIVKKDFKKAASLISDRKVKEQLKLNPTDALKAIMKLPKKMIMLYIHAYQSYLWNETVGRYLLSMGYDDSLEINYSLGKLLFCSDVQLIGLKDLEVPLIGALPLPKNVSIEMKEIIQEIMREEEISRYDFVIKQLPNMSAIGGNRKVVCSIKYLEIGEREVDELNSGKHRQMISFSLDKGVYATMAIQFLFVAKFG